MSTYTLEKIENQCREIAEMFNFSLDTPIKINGRLRTTLGRVKFQTINNVCVPTSIEFSKSYIENATNTQVNDTIRHEMAHWCATTATGEHHGHDEVWKIWCGKTGANPTRLYDKETMGELSAEAAPKMVAKYTLYCWNCNKVVGTRTRACKITKSPELFRTKCCNAGVRVKEN